MDRDCRSDSGTHYLLHSHEHAEPIRQSYFIELYDVCDSHIDSMPHRHPGYIGSNAVGFATKPGECVEERVNECAEQRSTERSVVDVPM